MNNSLLIRLSAITAALSMVALVSTAAGGRLPRPLGPGEQPLSAGVHVLDLVSLKQARSGYKHLPRIEITRPPGWFNYNGWGVNDGSALSVSFWDVDKVYPTGCRWQGKPKIDPGRTVAGLARALATRPLRHASRPAPVVLDGFDGKYLRWTVPSGINISRCDQGYFESWTGRGWTTDRWQQGPGQIDRLWILDVHGKRLVIDAGRLNTDSRAGIPELDRIVRSIRFLPDSPRKPAAAAPASTPACAQFQALRSAFPTARSIGFDTRTTVKREPIRDRLPGTCGAWWSTTYHRRGIPVDISLTLYKTHKQALFALANSSYGTIKHLANGAVASTDFWFTSVNGVQKRAASVSSVYRRVYISSASIAEWPIFFVRQFDLHGRVETRVHAMTR